MSEYTTQLRYICENFMTIPRHYGYENVHQIIDNAIPHIFDFYYPIFDPTYKKFLEQKIIRHFYTSEIGFETYGLFKLKLETKMNEIMPYFNQLYMSELLSFDVLIDTEYTKTTTKQGSGVNNNETKTKTISNNNTASVTINEANINKTSNSTQTIDTTQTTDNTTTKNDTTTTNGTDRYADTPQSGLTDVITGKYLTNARATSSSTQTNGSDTLNGTVKNTGTIENEINENTHNTGNTDTSQNTTGTTNNENTAKTDFKNKEEWLEHVTKKTAGRDMPELLMKFRETFLNIDMMVIEKLEPLFMLIY